MARIGVVALTDSEEDFISIDQPNGTQKMLPKGAYLVDARMFGGNSGGPVIVNNPLSALKLGGLITATNRGLDYGIATPVSQIVETLERAKETKPNLSAWFSLEETASKQ